MTESWSYPPRIRNRLADVEAIISDTMDEAAFPLAKQTRELLLPGGKMLRPALVLIGAGFGNPGKTGKAGQKRIAHIAAAMEMLHAATLIHDDIIDNADFRRGIPTLHTRFGVTDAVLAGDWLFSRSFRLAADYAGTGNSRALSRVVGSICSAEIRQDMGKYSYSTGKREYLRIIAGKTAALFSLSLHIGASEAAVAAPVAQALRRCGYDTGMAFQIIDDILDCESDEKTLRKPAGNDLKEGLCTLPLIFALESGAPGLRGLLSGPPDDGKIAEILALVSKSGALGKARGAAREYSDRARREIGRLPDCAAKDELTEVAESLLRRTY